MRSHGSSSSSSTSTTCGETVTESYSHSSSETHGESEGLEPTYENLPSAVHSYDNAVYMAAQKLRGLAAGEAYVSYVDQDGMHSARVRVPLVKQVAVADPTFVGIRALMLSRSPSALPTPDAAAQLDRREQDLVDAANLLRLPPAEPEDFRVKAPKGGERKGRRRSHGEPANVPEATLSGGENRRRRRPSAALDGGAPAENEP
jgi:hypothetical protein